MNKLAVFTVWGMLACALSPFATFAAYPVTATTRSATFHPIYRAYAEVNPIAPLLLRTSLAGNIEGLDLLPGSPTHTGENVARISGPQIAAQIRQMTASVNGYYRRMKLAADALRSARRTYPSFTNRVELDKAKSEFATAKAQYIRALAARKSLNERLVIRSPVNGRIMRIFVANGERITSEAPVLKILPDKGLWLLADYYGSRAREISPGMHGQFIPADDSPEIPVRVTSRIPGVHHDGSLTFGLMPTGKARWESGERGEVILQGQAQNAVSVPTSALVFDQGRWWVMAIVSDQPHRKAVTIGPTHGSNTIVTSGLAAGREIIVRNAYLIFHQDFAAHYTPPD